MTPKEKVQIAQYLGIGTLLFLLIKYQDFIANTLQNMAIAAISAVVLLFVVYDHLFGQKRIWTLFEFVTAKLIGIVIQLDPILIAKIDLKSLFDRKEKIKDEGIAGTRQIQAKIRQTLEKESDNYELAERESRSSDKTTAILARKKMEMIEKFIEKYKAQSEKAKFLENRLTDIYKALGFLYEYKTIELGYTEKDYLLSKTIKASLKTAWDILKGETTNTGLYNQSLDYMQNYISDANVQIDSMLSDCGEFLKSLEMGEILDDTKLVALESKTESFHTNLITELEKSKQTVK